MKPSPAQLRARKKFAAMARARGKASRAKKRGSSKKRKNPYQMVAFKKGQKGSARKSGLYHSKKELSPFRKAASRKPLVKSRRVQRARGAVRKFLKAAPAARKRAARFAAKSKKSGYTVKKIYISPKSLPKMARAVRRKKRKGGKRKVRKESKVAKRKRKSRSRRRKSPRRRKAARRRSRKSGRRKAKRGRGKTIVLKRKGQGVYIRRNPNLKAMVEQYSGFKAEELGSLLVGGAVYGTVDGLAAKYAPGVYAFAAKVPVIGTTVVPAAIGIALNIAGKKFKLNALSLLGEGILGASVVAMGIQASHYLPGISPSVSGVDFTAGRGVMMGGFARDGADFGNVDFTPGPGVLMGNAPQMGELVKNLGMDAQMGDTMNRDGADFGLVPEGLGGLG